MQGSLRWALRFGNTVTPFLATVAAVLIVVLFLFAYPLVSAALGLAVPLLVIASIAGVTAAMNLRWNLWHGRRPLFVGLADLGFIACLASFAVYGFASVVDSWTTIPYIAIGVVTVGIFRFAFFEFEAWILGIGFGVLILLLFGAYISFTILQPAWFFDFMASLLLVTSLALVLSGSFAGFMESRKKTAREDSPVWFRLTLAALALMLIAAVALSAVVTLSSRSSLPAAATEGGAVRLTIDDSKFQGSHSPELLIGPGETRLVIKNTDLLVHTFTIDGLGVDVVVGPGQEELVQFDAPVGDFAFRCRVPGHTERYGRLHVLEP